MNKAEDIEQLIYRELPPDRYCYIHNFIVEKDKEIERLNNENKMLKEAVKEKVIATCNTCEDYGICPHSYREYDLNNIINELEKELNIAYKELQPNEMVIGQNLIKNIQITIKELKGSDKE